VENGYTVNTTPHLHEPSLVSLTWNDLQAIDFKFNTPFCLYLDNKQALICERIVRLIPKRRIVVYGLLNGKHIVAKLFIDAKRAKLQLEKDIAGIKLLKENKVPTPALIHQGTTLDQRAHVLVLDRITYADNLAEIWQSKHNVDTIVMLALQAVVLEIATQHVFGIVQQDLHLKNFLVTEKVIYTLDGGQIQIFPPLLPKAASMNNLALFLSQLSVDAEGYQEELFKHYAKARGWQLKPQDFVDLMLLIKKWDALRWEKFQKKIYRECTQFVGVEGWRFKGMYDREYTGPELMDFLASPDSAFKNNKAEILKAGRSATVIKVTLDDRDYVIKRYNIKNMWHRLRRCLRQTRASLSWRLAHKLRLFDVPVARPVAFIENRLAGLRGSSYYVTEYVSGEHAGTYFDRHLNNNTLITEMVKRIHLLLKRVSKLELTHGDLKITNILVNTDHQPVLIDLDGALEHMSLSGLNKTWEKELERFLRNFDVDSIIRKQFEAEFERW
jgi:tRNA A-37 threonylcarbamoyl transferase component Bud32